MKRQPPRLSNAVQTRLGGELISAQIAAQLLAEMRNGCYAAAEQLPAELELADLLKVSRTVVRDALSELERSGCVERVRGIGTVINHGVVALEYRCDQKLEFYRMIETTGHHPHSDHLLVTREEADEDTAAALRIAAGQTVLCVCKRVLADEQPVLFSTDVLPLSLFGGRRLDSIDFSRPIFTILQQTCGIQTASTVTHLHAAIGDPTVRRLLGLNREQALLQLDELCYDRLCRPVVCCRTYYTDFFDFPLVRKLL